MENLTDPICYTIKLSRGAFPILALIFNMKADDETQELASTQFNIFFNAGLQHHRQHCTSANPFPSSSHRSHPSNPRAGGHGHTSASNSDLSSDDNRSAPITGFSAITYESAAHRRSSLRTVSARLVKDANCRAGPSTAYDVVTSFSKGQVLQIVGRNPDLKNTWWLVVIPGTNSKCWISLVTAQATGDFDSLPIIHPPY